MKQNVKQKRGKAVGKISLCLIRGPRVSEWNNRGSSLMGSHLRLRRLLAGWGLFLGKAMASWIVAYRTGLHQFTLQDDYNLGNKQ